ncbi:MAG: 4'-phosphopantetheinyl transferase superfamily protein [Desulfovibrio sp.]|nr:4'-phosphopantetheinyl transferase superfamily protein [Desulfovibrio sp.]
MAALDGGIDVDVWTVRTGWTPADAAKFLSDGERQRMNAFADKKTRSRYARIHGILRILLAWYLEAEPGRVHMEYTPEGKPFLPRQELHFNLSHAEDAALFAFCKGYPVGIDVEPVRSLPEAEHIAERWFSPGERIWINSSPRPEHAFARCWVCREAIGKASGKGLAHALQPAALKYLTGRLLSAENYFVSDWEPWAGYVAAVACFPGIDRIASGLEAYSP